jgi:hypothetical protein
MPSIEQKFTTFCSNGQPPARFQVDNYFSLAGEPLSLEVWLRRLSIQIWSVSGSF